MKKFNCLLVEDEPLAAEVLQDYIAQVPFMECVAVCRDGLQAIELLQQQAIDVMFLDIHLPRLKGLDLVRTLKNPPQIIITTAYREYALDGYELDVTDYLLKPIQFARFLAAVNKLRRTTPTVAGITPQTARPAPKAFIFFNVNKKQVKTFVDDILYIESRKEYIYVATKDRAFLTKYQLSEIEEQLGTEKFLRIHRSFIVAKDKITAFGAFDVELGELQVPIGRSYKEAVMLALRNNH